MFIVFEEISKTGIKYVLFGGNSSQIIQQYQDVNELNKLSYELSKTGDKKDLEEKNKIERFLEKYYSDEISEKDIINFNFCSSIYSHKTLKYVNKKEDMKEFIEFIVENLDKKENTEKYNEFLEKLKNSFENTSDYKYVLKHLKDFREIKNVVL